MCVCIFLRAIQYGLLNMWKILVMLVYGEYYGQVYEVYNKYTIFLDIENTTTINSHVYVASP